MFSSQVSNNARANLFLKALSSVADQGISLCGQKTTCLELAYAAIFRMGWQAAAVLALLLVAAPNLVLALLNTVMSASHCRDQAATPFLDAAEEGRQIMQLQRAQKRWSQPAWQMLSASSSSYAPGSAAGDPHHVIDLQRAAGEGGGMKWQVQYSPVLRMRKSAFFNQPLQMELTAPCDSKDYS